MFKVSEMIDGNIGFNDIDEVELGVMIDDFYEVYVSDERDESTFIKWGGDNFVEIQFDSDCNYKISKE